MKLKCSNCGQNYNTKDLPPNADLSLCPYCGHSVARLARPAPAGQTKPGKRGWLRTIAILILFAIPAIINYLEELKPSAEKTEAGVSDLSAYLAGFYLREAEERYYDQKKTYTDDANNLYSLSKPLKTEEGVTLLITQASAQGFTLLATPDGSETTFVFQQLPPLHRAARSGDTGRVKDLIANGADVNTQDVSNRTPLFYTRFCKHPEVENLLLSNGAIE